MKTIYILFAICIITKKYYIFTQKSIEILISDHINQKLVYDPEAQEHYLFFIALHQCDALKEKMPFLSILSKVNKDNNKEDILRVRVCVMCGNPYTPLKSIESFIILAVYHLSNHFPIMERKRHEPIHQNSRDHHRIGPIGRYSIRRHRYRWPRSRPGAGTEHPYHITRWHPVGWRGVATTV